MMDFATIGSSFGLLFVMELGDKTQLAVISLASRTGRGWPVFAGAALALVALTVVAVILGTVAAEFLPEEPVSIGAGVVFIIVGAFVLWSVWRASGDEDETSHRFESKARGTLSLVGLTLVLIVVAELGDKSQLAVVGLAARSGEPVEVFAGAAGALVTITVLAAFIGSAAARRIPRRLISAVSGVLFILVGALSLAGVT